MAIPENLLLNYYSKTNQGKNVISDEKHEACTQEWVISGAKGLRALFLGAGMLEIDIQSQLKGFKEIVFNSIDASMLAIFREKIPGIKTVQCDLSGGLCEEINQIATQITAEDSAESVANKVSALVKDFTPDLKSIVDTLGTADYVVSLNVSSQISAYALNFLEVHCESKLKQKLSFKEADKQALKQKMLEHHFTLLKCLKGRVCYVDTFLVQGISKAKPDDVRKHQLIPEAASQFLAKNFDKLNESSWDWVVKEDDKTKHWYTVKAFILSSNPKDSAESDKKE